MMYLGRDAAGDNQIMRSSLKLNSDYNDAIRAEIGDRLRMLLSKEQPRLPSRIQHLLDRLSRLDATISK